MTMVQFDREAFEKLNRRIEQYFVQGVLNLQDEEAACNYAIGAMHAELDVFCKRWYDTKVNEQVQREAQVTCTINERFNEPVRISFPPK